MAHGSRQTPGHHSRPTGLDSVFLMRSPALAGLDVNVNTVIPCILWSSLSIACVDDSDLRIHERMLYSVSGNPSWVNEDVIKICHEKPSSRPQAIDFCHKGRILTNQRPKEPFIYLFNFWYVCACVIYIHVSCVYTDMCVPRPEVNKCLHLLLSTPLKKIGNSFIFASIIYLFTYISVYSFPPGPPIPYLLLFLEGGSPWVYPHPSTSSLCRNRHFFSYWGQQRSHEDWAVHLLHMPGCHLALVCSLLGSSVSESSQGSRLVDPAGIPVAFPSPSGPSFRQGRHFTNRAISPSLGRRDLQDRMQPR
jgi:hypothetical protein